MESEFEKMKELVSERGIEAGWQAHEADLDGLRAWDLSKFSVEYLKWLSTRDIVSEKDPHLERIFIKDTLPLNEHPTDERMAEKFMATREHLLELASQYSQKKERGRHSI